MSTKYQGFTLVALLIAVALCSACTKKVTLKRSAQNVEIASASAVASARLKCDELELIYVTTQPHERSDSERWTVAEIKARNLGASVDATHLVWQDEEDFPCNRDGERLMEGSNEAKNARTCKRLSAMAYQCMVGEAPRP